MVNPQGPVIIEGFRNEVAHYFEAVGKEAKPVGSVKVPAPFLPGGDIVKGFLLQGEVPASRGRELGPEVCLSKTRMYKRQEG